MNLKVLFLTIGTEVTASSRTRVYQYIPYLRRAGIEYSIIPMSKGLMRERKNKVWNIVRKGLTKIIGVPKYMKLILLLKKYDVVFIQKVLPPICIQRIIRKLSKCIIFDFDDAIWIFSETPNLVNMRQMKLLIHMIRISDHIIVENVYNKKFAALFNRNISIITGPIDCEKYRPRKDKRKSKNVVIGWIGSPFTTRYLKLLSNVFRKICKNYPNVVIELIGASDLTIEGVNFLIKNWSLESEIRNLRGPHTLS